MSAGVLLRESGRRREGWLALATVSVRAEVHRLRSVLTQRTQGTLDVTAAPYRLQG